MTVPLKLALLVVQTVIWRQGRITHLEIVVRDDNLRDGDGRTRRLSILSAVILVLRCHATARR